jgi:hypothetical protein
MRPVRNVQRQGLRALAESVAPLTAPLSGKRGFAAARLLAEWPSIVGPPLAARSRPERIAAGRDGTEQPKSGGTLVVRIASGPLALELQHQEPLICERINSFFGWQAVARLRLVHGPVPPLPAPSPPPPLPPADDATIDAAVSDIDDPSLAAVLRALAARVLAARSPGDP